jgi:hypothetical protein
VIRRFRICAAVAVAVAVAVAARPVGAVPVQDGPVEIATFPTDDYELADTADDGTATIEIALADGADPGDVDVSVVDTAELINRGLASAFRFKRLHRAAIELAVDFRRVNRPLTYKVTIAVSEMPRPPYALRFKPVSHTVKLAHPAAKLRVIPDKLVIERVGWWPGSGEWVIPALEIEETTGLSRVTPDGRDLRATKSGTDLVTAGLTLTVPPLAMAGHDQVTIAITGEAPGGTATGSAELHAPQIGDSVAFSYELRSRLHPGMIALALLVGLGFGYGAKRAYHVLLDRVRLRRELAEIAKQAFDARKALDSELVAALEKVEKSCLAASQRPGTLCERLARLVAKVKNALQRPGTLRERLARLITRHAVDLGAVRDSSRRELDDAINRWKQRLAEQQTRVADLAHAVEPRWRAPAELRGWLDALRAGCAHARMAVECGDAAQAKTIVDGAMAVGKSTEEALAAWQTTVLDLATQLAQIPGLQAAAKWPDAAAEIAAQIAARLEELGKGVEIVEGGAAALAKCLASIHAVQVHLDTSAAQLAATWGLVLAAAERELSSTSPNLLAGLAAKLPRPGSDAVKYLTAIVSQGHAIVGEFHKRLLEAIPQTEHATVIKALGEGKWSHAAAAVARAQAGPQGPVMGLAPGATEAVEAAAAAASAEGRPPDAAWPVITTPLGDVNVVLQRAIRVERLAAEVSSLLSFLSLVVLYLIHYMPMSIGTGPELVGVIAQALTLDVGIDAVAQGVKGIVK